MEIPVVVNGQERFADRDLREYFDPSQYHDRILVAKCALANESDAIEAVTVARADPDGWRSKTHQERHEIFARAAHEIRKARGDLIGSASAATGKVFSETDVEVSEAIDFAEFYPYSVRAFGRIETITAQGKGVGLVISPWNFPVAIPCGGVTAALSSGNTVIFKPSSDAHSHGLDSVPVLLARRCASDRPAVSALLGRPGWRHVDQSPGRGFCHPDRWYGNRLENNPAKTGNLSGRGNRR
jgi:RHH-type proline utilization regulon transcriptional repressor/proline dehydrogenase/delta 1-pyrroline-5-carboxylate dehydrogenase